MSETQTMPETTSFDSEEVARRIKLRSEQAQKMFGGESTMESILLNTIDPMSIHLRMKNFSSSVQVNTYEGKPKNVVGDEIYKVIKATKNTGVLSKRKLEELTKTSTLEATASSSTSIQLYDDSKGGQLSLVQENNSILKDTKRLEDTQAAVAAYENSYYSLEGKDESTRAIILQEKRRRKEIEQKPKWHAPWKLMRVITGAHNGWVRCISVDVSNEWFVTGSNDRTIKIFDLASGELKLTLPGHTSTVRDLTVSDRSPYLFSVSEDKSVRCWDLETNKCIRKYHGHLSGVYCCALHPTLDVLVTGGRDSSCRVWDVRTKNQIFLLTGHESTVASVLAQEHEPQVVSGSMDSMIRLWDLKTGTTRTTLTHHKKSVRAMAIHPSEYTFASASADSIRRWKCPEGKFLNAYEGANPDVTIHSMAVNNEGVLVCGADDGQMSFWDWKTGHHFSSSQNIPQPGSLDSEAAVFACKFDRSGSRLITGGADKTIKVYCQDETAVPPEDDEEPKFYITNLFGKKKY